MALPLHRRRALGPSHVRLPSGERYVDVLPRPLKIRRCFTSSFEDTHTFYHWMNGGSVLSVSLSTLVGLPLRRFIIISQFFYKTATFICCMAVFASALATFYLRWRLFLLWMATFPHRLPRVAAAVAACLSFYDFK